MCSQALQCTNSTAVTGLCKNQGLALYLSELSFLWWEAPRASMRHTQCLVNIASNTVGYWDRGYKMTYKQACVGRVYFYWDLNIIESPLVESQGQHLCWGLGQQGGTGVCYSSNSDWRLATELMAKMFLEIWELGSVLMLFICQGTSLVFRWREKDILFLVFAKFTWKF